MRCRTHPSDRGAGVCACCLRERLSGLSVSPVKDDDKPSMTIWKKPVSSSSPPALFCPWPPFPDYVDEMSTADGSCGGGQKSGALKSSNLSPIPILLGKHTPKKVEIDAIVSKPSASSFSFLALLLRHRMKNKKKSSNILPMEEDVSRGRSRKPHEPPVNGRGMSPASNDEAEDDGRGLPPPSLLRRKLAASQLHNTQIPKSPRSVSSFALCLSPLVRPSRGNRRNYCPAQAVLSGHLRGTFIRRFSSGGAALAEASSGLAPNRSRKLVDLGKVW